MMAFPSPLEDTQPSESPKHTQSNPLLLLDDIKNVCAIEDRPTGAYYFIALRLLIPGLPASPRLARHDLESFYWVLVWVVLRHTNHDDPEGMKSCDRVFPYGNDRRATDAKTAWIYRYPDLKIHNNEPFSALLRKLLVLVYEATRAPRFAPQIPLVYDTLFQAFGEAIARDDWPVDDKAIPFDHEEPWTETVFGEQSINMSISSSGIGLKRTFGEYVTGTEPCGDLTSSPVAILPNVSSTESTKPEKRRKGNVTDMIEEMTAA
ncbi:hypothetical protein C8Q79DRAFT_946143 [Trametes meyenii]|nr:hypothetical protein C8Q79DRAFT_946143 [Trametes meyenii]